MKKLLMRQYWRVQQSQALISLGFWTATITLLLWPYVSWRFEDSETLLGIPMTYLGLMGIATAVLSLVLLVGFLYDVTFGLWRDHITVTRERDPFTTYKLNPTWGIVLAQTNEILKRVASDDEEVQRYCGFIDRLLEWNSKEEIWARAMSSWRGTIGDDDPFLFYLDEEARTSLDKTAESLEDF